MPRINLLPWREQQRIERKQAFGIGLAGAFVGALVVTGLGWLFMGQLIDAQNSRNARLRTEIAVLDKQIEEINSLEEEKRQSLARMQIIEQLQRSRSEIVHVFDTFVQTIPERTYLTNITQSEQQFRVEGVAQSPSLVSNFMRSVDESDWLTLHDDGLEDVVLTGTTQGSASAPAGAPQGQKFILTLKQRTSAVEEAEAAARAAAQRRTTP